MRLPQYTDYQTAIQTPSIAFKNDPELARCRPESLMGSPWARTGNFAYTYRLLNGGRQWAIRCFSRYDPGQQRYAAISRFVNTHPTDFFVSTQYKAQGILVNGNWFPMTKTEWVQGKTLEVHIDETINKHQSLADLLNRFQQMVAKLESLGAAHGDLQHGNILVSNGRLVLIDYDGMYVPELSGYGTEERGHPDYQHLTRNKQYGPHLDRFSSIVIYLSLRALMYKPELWSKYSAGGDHLILKQKDFISPDSSSVLRDIEAIPDLRALVQQFRNICKSDLAQVPRLTDFLSGKVVVSPTAIRIPVEQWGQYPTMAATDRLNLLNAQGQQVTIVGQIVDHHSALTKTGEPYVFLSFADWRQGAFRLVLWSEALKLFESRGRDPKGYLNLWVSITGLVTQYQRGEWPARPQIIVSTPSEIEVLAGGIQEARQRLPAEYDLEDIGEDTDAGRTKRYEVSHYTPTSTANSRAEEHINRGRAHQDQGRLDKAIREYKAAVQMAPNLALARSYLGWAYQQQGRWDEAIEEYDAVLRLEPGNIWAHRQLGWAHGDGGRIDRSVQAFQSALQINSNDAESHFGLGWAFGAQGRLDLAIRENQIALRINPNMDGAHVNLGWAYARQGRLDKANAEYQAAVRINPSNELAHCNLGVNYRAQGRIQEAVNELRIAVNLGHEPAKELLRQMGQWQEPKASPYQKDRNTVDWEVPPGFDEDEDEDWLPF
jgi:tetratricopeptide (TPR) repeat protein